MSEKNKCECADTFETKVATSDTSALFQKIDAYVMENIGNMNTISVKSISKHFGISVGYISKLYKKHANSNYITHVLYLRVEKAKKLLATMPSLKIKDIASILGYYNPISFARLFKRHTGMTPGEYRFREVNKSKK